VIGPRARVAIVRVITTVLLAGGVAGSGEPGGAGENRVDPVPVETYPDFFYHPPPEIPVVHLGAAAIDSLGRAVSDRNMDLLTRIDGYYREGEYGPPDSREAREDAMAAFIYNAETAFELFAKLATQHDVIYSTSEEDLALAFTEGFRNPGFYPIVNLVDARTGFGRFCLKFEVEDERRREIVVAGEEMRAWTEMLERDGRRFPVVNIDMMTMSHDRVHIVCERYACGNVAAFEITEREQPVRVVVMEDMTGQYVRKWGFHRPKAVVLWKSVSRGIVPPPREARFLSSAIYVPRLKLTLPWFLPDIGFDDLRRFDFPEPLLTVESVDEIRSRDLGWIRIRRNQRFAGWEGDGSVPGFVRRRFPDF
jgi:hypothetical protein